MRDLRSFHYHFTRKERCATIAIITQKERFEVDTEKLKSLSFPTEYTSFNQLCYDLVCFDGKPCSSAQRDKLKTNSIREHIKNQIRELADYTCEKPVGKRDERQIIHGMRDMFRELMENELTDGANATYTPFLLPLLKDMVNDIYSTLGIGKHVLRTYKLINGLDFMGSNYTSVGKDAQNRDYSNMVIDKLDDNIKSTVERHLKSLNKNAVGFSVYKAGTLNNHTLIHTHNSLYNNTRDQIKKTLSNCKRLTYLTSKRMNEMFLAKDPNWQHSFFYYNWIVEIEPSFTPLTVNENLNYCRKKLNEQFILKLKRDIGYAELADFSESESYQIIRNEIDGAALSCDDMRYDYNPNITNGYYIPEHLKQFMFIGEIMGNDCYYDIYRLGTYLYDINYIVSRSML